MKRSQQMRRFTWAKHPIIREERGAISVSSKNYLTASPSSCWCAKIACRNNPTCEKCLSEGIAGWDVRTADLSAQVFEVWQFFVDLF